MTKHVQMIGAMLLLLCVMTGCSRKLVVLSLDDAIKTIAGRANEAHCAGVPLVKEVAAEFYVETAQKISAGAPTGAIPITLSGEASAKESTKVTVFIDPQKMNCGQKMFEGFIPTVYLYDPIEGTVREPSK
jgi:hypothetical protein